MDLRKTERKTSKASINIQVFALHLYTTILYSNRNYRYCQIGGDDFLKNFLNFKSLMA